MTTTNQPPMTIPEILEIMDHQSAVTSQKIGQEWCLCSAEWEIDDMITIESSHGRLVLCNVYKETSGNWSAIRRVPVLPKLMPTI